MTQATRGREVRIGGMLALCFAAACAPVLEPGQPQFGTITGKVVDLPSGAPLGFAIVQVNNTHLGATTKPDGTFQIDRVPSGRRSLQIKRVGYHPRTTGAVIVTATRPAVVNASLKRYAITGTIVTTGYPEPGVGMRSPFSTAIIRFDELGFIVPP